MVAITPIMTSKTETPIIGILSSETYIVENYFPGETHAGYIASSYVKYLESAGARVIPIWIGQSEDYYKRVVNYTNGILFPGGGVYFTEPAGYGEAAKELYKLAVELNQNGTYYPLWGTCLGMQAFAFAAAGKDIRVNCSLKNTPVALEFVEGFQDGKLFSNAPENIIDILKSTNVTFNNHMYCLTQKVLDENGMLRDWKVLSTNKDSTGFEFISVFEMNSYPFYGVQFHPEKNRFEFGNAHIPHRPEAVKISEYFANFFVDECRNNSNSFPDNDLEKKSLIYNYNPRYTGKLTTVYEQIYVFDTEDFDNAQLI